MALMALRWFSLFALKGEWDPRLNAAMHLLFLVVTAHWSRRAMCVLELRVDSDANAKVHVRSFFSLVRKVLSWVFFGSGTSGVSSSSPVRGGKRTLAVGQSMRMLSSHTGTNVGENGSTENGDDGSGVDELSQAFLGIESAFARSRMVDIDRSCEEFQEKRARFRKCVSVLRWVLGLALASRVGMLLMSPLQTVFILCLLLSVYFLGRCRRMMENRKALPRTVRFRTILSVNLVRIRLLLLLLWFVLSRSVLPYATVGLSLATIQDFALTCVSDLRACARDFGTSVTASIPPQAQSNPAQFIPNEISASLLPVEDSLGYVVPPFALFREVLEVFMVGNMLSDRNEEAARNGQDAMDEDREGIGMNTGHIIANRIGEQDEDEWLRIWVRANSMALDLAFIRFVWSVTTRLVGGPWTTGEEI
ncbi:hypothetical protein HK102_002219 [Quaeritorhiza haematococci]|nr:hypothetical protein HK102_002219 [Quaeritorhiza haematococci]